jgi:hypothetical protein
MRMSRRSRTFIATATMVLLGPSGALANPSARLVYARGAKAASCPTETDVRQAVAARLGYDPFVLWSPTTIVVDVSRRDGRYEAVVRLLDDQGIERGTRHLASRSAHCGDIIATLALTISIVVDPLSLRPAPIAEPRTPAARAASAPETTAPASSLLAPPPPPAPPPPVPAAATAPPASSTRRPVRELRPFVGIAPLAAFQPRPASGAAISGGIRWRALSLELDARAILRATSDAATPGTPKVRIDGQSLGFTVLPCVWIGPAFVCTGAGLEAVTVRGEVPMPHRSSALEWIVGARLGAQIALSAAVGLRPYAELVVRPAAPSVTIDSSPATPAPFLTLSGEVGVASIFMF